MTIISYFYWLIDRTAKLYPYEMLDFANESVCNYFTGNYLLAPERKHFESFGTNFHEMWKMSEYCY